jgi:hypothetical protein
MELEKKENTQIIIHKSNWGSQIVYVIIVVLSLFLSIKNNPTKREVISSLISELSKKEAGCGVSSSNAIGEIGTNMLGDIIEPFVIRRDFLLFSTYEIDLKNENFTLNAKANGVWNNIIFDNSPNFHLNENWERYHPTGSDDMIIFK